MLEKGSKLNSILTGSCPKCQEESMYLDKNPYHLSNTLKMHETCGHCGMRYKIEPSFFYGAMYVSYGFNVGILVVFWLAASLLFEDFNVWGFVGIAGLAGIILTPITFRISRLIWIKFFVKYKQHAPQTSKDIEVQARA